MLFYTSPPPQTHTCTARLLSPQEAEYYGLTALVAEIDRYPWGLVTVSRGVLNTQDSWLYEVRQGGGGAGAGRLLGCAPPRRTPWARQPGPPQALP